jgi:flagellar hook-associated protein 1 FlgK
MSLATATNIAQSALNVVTAQTAVLSRNIANANDSSGASTKIANVTSVPGSGAEVVSITSAQNLTLFENVLNATSSSATQNAISSGLDQLEQTIGATSDATDAQSPATLLSSFTDALQTYESSPSDSSLADAAVSAASTLASSLNSATTTVQGVREQADADMSQSVTQINSLLQQFQTLNNQVVSGTATGADVTDALDGRNAVLTQLAQQIGITTVTSPNNSVNIYTDSGVTLFQGTARTVSFVPTTTYTAGTTGNAVTVDGVPITGSSTTMGIQSGALAGYANLRDSTAVTYQNQLDSIAGALISATGETDQSGNGGPEQPGLFTTAGATTMPTSTTGLAGAIEINASVDPTQGGNAMLLRDGGISDTSNSDYTYNTSGDASYSGRIDDILNQLSATTSFSSSGGIGTSATLSTYASNSVSWLQGQRSTVSAASTYQSTLLSQATTALSSATGVNIDTQMSQMLNLENSYQASAKLISTISAMFTGFMSALGVTT